MSKKTVKVINDFGKGFVIVYIRGGIVNFIF